MRPYRDPDSVAGAHTRRAPRWTVERVAATVGFTISLARLALFWARHEAPVGEPLAALAAAALFAPIVRDTFRRAPRATH